MYSFESRVRYSECDAEARLSPVAMVNYLQDCSTFHSEKLGHGLEFMEREHIAWLIAAWQIEVRRLPRFCERITVSTWCYGTSRTQAGRCFVIQDGHGNDCVRADSLWFTFDTKARRPVRIPSSEDVYVEDGRARLDLPPTERKLALEGGFRERAPIVIGAQQIDTNGHVNNAQYLPLAISALEAPIDIRRVCVQYRRMALLGDTIVPRVHEKPGRWTVDLADQDGRSYAVVRLEGSVKAASSDT